MIERIKEIIAYSGLSDRAFAIKCGLAQNTLNRQLNGVRELSLATVMLYYPLLKIFPQNGCCAGKELCYFRM